MFLPQCLPLPHFPVFVDSTRTLVLVASVPLSFMSPQSPITQLCRFLPLPLDLRSGDSHFCDSDSGLVDGYSILIYPSVTLGFV